MASILVVDDELSMREFLSILLEKQGHHVFTAGDPQRALATADSHQLDLVITDIRMGSMSGLDLLKDLKDRYADLPVLLITAFASPEDAVSAMKNGAFDYITKPFKVDEIIAVVNAALQAPTAPATASRQQSPSHDIIGNSPEMLKIFDLINRIAPTHANVLIYGESGTGKELVAKAIHKSSKAAANAFVPITCNAIPETLFESELFGHVKGSFTGATANTVGLFGQANNGTAFLDEVGELTPLTQTKLLRVLQEREFKRVGDTQITKINVRIISATNRNLEEEVMHGNFREDLFYRLAVVPIRMPPLRERKGDVPLLIDFFLKKYAKIFDKEVRELSSYAMEVLMNYDYPGNVRELENIIERGVALATSNIILPESLTLSSHRKKAAGASTGEIPENLVAVRSEEELFDEGLEKIMARFEKKLLITALEKTNYSKMRAADLLKISFRSFRYKLQKYNL
ncbi:MAG: Fis family transcriptional regulator [Desulfobulbaceae bacterium]|nr:MAG: Fis family transcriptional regulator [Desulfobulbaceae bacterium]